VNRRGFMLLAAATAIARNPVAAEIKIPQIGLIQPGSPQQNPGLLDSFRQGLSALGWTDGGNIAVLDRWADERTERLPAIVQEVIGSGVSVLVTAGTPATLAAKRATASTPIVLVGVDDPVALGIVDSLGQPRRQRHGPLSELVRSDRRTAGSAEGARPRATTPCCYHQA
jgi:putative ABC transport system substrate-binding protein